jgi:PEP-CTERM motif
MKFHLRTSVLYFALGLVPAYCTTITTYTNPATWQAATSAGYQTVTFEGLTPPNTETPYNNATGVTASGVDFIGYNSAGVSDAQVVDTSGVFTWFNWGTGDALIQSLDRPNSSSPLPYINIVLPANISSLGLDLFTTSPQALSYTITVAGNQYTVPTFSQPTLAFWGITSDTPITSVQLTLAGTTFNSSSNELLDNFSFGASDLTAAPEAGTYLLIGSGLIGFVLLRKRLISGKAGREL